MNECCVDDAQLQTFILLTPTGEGILPGSRIQVENINIGGYFHLCESQFAYTILKGLTFPVTTILTMTNANASSDNLRQRNIPLL